MLVFDDRDMSKSALDHLRSCASCQPRLNRLRSILADVAARTNASAPNTPHLNESDLMCLAEGGGGAPEQIAHLAACVHCRGELSSLSSLFSDPQIEAEIRRAEAPRALAAARSRQVAFRAGSLITLAAAAALLFVVWPHNQPLSAPARQAVGPSPHRAPTITVSGAPIPTSPIGDIEARPAFKWSWIAGADRYRLTLYNESGEVIFESQVVGTTLTLPDSVITVPGRSYVWQVEGRNGVDRWTPSELVEFRIVARAP